MLLEKLAYLSRGADYVVFAGSLPRGIDDDFYAEAVRELNRRGAQTVLDSEGEPLRLGVQAEPLLVSPNEREAEALVGQEFHDDDDFLAGLETIAELGARNVLITRESGCWALLRADRQTIRFRALAPRVDAVSAVGSGDVLLAGFIAARLDGRTDEEALRSAVAAGAASTLELGAGRFEPREAGRLSQGSKWRSSSRSAATKGVVRAPLRHRRLRRLRVGQLPGRHEREPQERPLRQPHLHELHDCDVVSSGTVADDFTSGPTATGSSAPGPTGSA